jgi:hypothetical protein
MKILGKIYYGPLALLGMLWLGACEKSDEYRNAKPVTEVSENIYEVLKGQQGLYDTLLIVIEKAGLTDTLKEGNITFFAPQDQSIRTAMYNLNFSRLKYGFDDNWTLDSVPAVVWDTLLRRYMMDGVVRSDSLQYADGVNLTTLSYGFRMNGKAVTSNAGGIVKGGPLQLQYSDMNNSRFWRDWSTSNTRTIDLKTSNGLLHVLESQHVFGFSSFVAKAFPYSLNPVQAPYSGLPIPIPGTIESEDYDEGGEGIAFHDTNPKSDGGQYRTEGVDIENCSEGGYNIGWTVGSEWLEYTVEVQETAKYNASFRMSAGSANGGDFHLEVDGVNVTGKVHCPRTGGYQTWVSVDVAVDLTAGKHILRFYEESGGYNINKIVFTKL